MKKNRFYPRRFRFVSKEGKPLIDPPIPIFDPFCSDLVEEFINDDKSNLYGFNMPHSFGVVIKNVLLEGLNVASSSNQITLLYYTADWCVSCRQLERDAQRRW
jgi:hypothetical protein